MQGEDEPARRDARRVTRAVAAAAISVTILLTLTAGCRGGGGDDEAPEPSDTTTPPATEIAPVTPTEREVVLFFPGPNDALLHAEPRSVLPIGTAEDRAKQCLEELIHGPSPPLLAAVPDGTRVRQVYVLADGTAFADFSGDILHHRGGSLGELQTIYAIVDTLAANVREIRRVGILVDGRVRDTLAGHVDLTHPLPPDYRYVEARSRPANALDGVGGPAGEEPPADGGEGSGGEGGAGESGAGGGGAGESGASGSPEGTSGDRSR